MKRFPSLMTTAALAGVLLSGGSRSEATTPYALYIQPIASTNVYIGGVVTFRVLVDIPASPGTLSLTLGPAITYDPVVTGSNHSKFNFVRDSTEFSLLPGSGVPFWDSSLANAFSSTTSTPKLQTFQGVVGHTKQSDPNTGATLTVPAGTYTVGTFTLPINSLPASGNTMDIQLPTAFGLAGPNTSQDFVDNVSSVAMHDGVLNFPNDGVTHLNRLRLTILPGVNVTGRLAIEGVSDLTKTNVSSPLSTFRIEFRTPGTTNAVKTADVTLTPVGPGSPYGTYSIANVPIGVYDVAIKGIKQLRVLIPAININRNFTLPDRTLPSGDANNDNIVDIVDFGLLINAYGTGVGATSYSTGPDFNYDGTVDIADFGILVNEYGNVGSP